MRTQILLFTTLLSASLVQSGCTAREDHLVGTYQLNNIGNNKASLNLQGDHTYIQEIEIAGNNKIIASGSWAFGLRPASQHPQTDGFNGKSSFDSHSNQRIFLSGAYSLENCPKCKAVRYDSVGLPIEKFLGLVMLVDSPDEGIAYQKQ
jgi:hypothetical protein